MAAPSYNGLPDTSTMHLLGDLETGKVVTIFFSRKKPEKRTLEIKPTTSQLVWIKAQGVRPEGSSMFFSDAVPFYYFRLFIVATGCPSERCPQKMVSCYRG